MADTTIRFILEAIDNASAQINGVGQSINGLSDKSKLLLAGIGAATAGGLILAAKAAADEEAAINAAARATADAAGGYDKARAAIVQLNTEMEAQGFKTEDTVAAFSALVNKAGQDVPTALKNVADVLAYSELPTNSLTKSIKLLAKEEGDGIKLMEGSAKSRLENADMTLRLAIANEKLANIIEKIGTKMLPVIEIALDFGTKMMDAFEKLDPVIQDIIITITVVVAVMMSIVGALAGLSIAIAPVVTMLGGMGAILSAVGTAITAVGAIILAIIASPIALLVGAIALIIGAVLAVKMAWDSNFLNMQNSIAAFVLIVGGIMVALGAILLLPIVTLAAIVVAWEQNWFGIRDTLSNVVTTITTAIETFITNIKTKWDTWITGLLTAISTFGTKVVAEVQNFVTKLTTDFEALIKKGAQWGAQLVQAVLDGISKKAAEIADAAAGAAKTASSIIFGTKGATGLVSTGVRMMAQGGIVSKPTMAMLGEGGENEYVIPESKMAQFMGGRGSTSISFTISEQKDARLLAREIQTILLDELGASNTLSGVTMRE